MWAEENLRISDVLVDVSIRDDLPGPAYRLANSTGLSDTSSSVLFASKGPDGCSVLAGRVPPSKRKSEQRSLERVQKKTKGRINHPARPSGGIKNPNSTDHNDLFIILRQDIVEEPLPNPARFSESGPPSRILPSITLFSRLRFPFYDAQQNWSLWCNKGVRLLSGGRIFFSTVPQTVCQKQMARSWTPGIRG